MAPLIAQQSHIVFLGAGTGSQRCDNLAMVLEIEA
jgi:hypothetical protein